MRTGISHFVFVSISACVAASSAYCPTVHAQNNPALADQQRPSDAVVITATRIPTRTNEITSDVTVISREELDKGASSLKEVLRAVPGVEVLQSGGQGTSMTLNIRGTNTDHVLVLIDGVRLGSATLGTTTLQNMPLDTIERIEIVRGPASSLYGSSAIGGVMQIFTRSGRGNPGANFSASYGSYNTTNISTGIGHEQVGLRYAFQLGGTHTNGFNAIKNARAASFNADSDGYRNNNFSGQIVKEFKPGQEIGLRHYSSDGASRFDSTPAANDFRIFSYLTSTSIHARTPIGDRWKTQLTVASSTDDSTSHTSPRTSSVIRTIQDQMVWQNDVQLPFGSAMIALESIAQKVNGTTVFPVTSRKINSLALAWQANAGNHHVQLSGRSDHYDQFGTRNTGYAGYGLDLGQFFRVTAGTGSAFKAPTFNQLYFPGFGNASLKPESARNSEVGLQYNGLHWQAGVVYFHNLVQNLIVNTGVPLTPQNVGKARITGTTFTLTTQAYDTDISGNLNLQDPRDASNNLLLPRRARMFMNLSLSRSMFGGKGSLGFQHSGTRYDDAANLLRLGGYGLLNAYYERPIDRQWTAFARVDNLGDKTYEMVRDFAVPGRSLFVGVRYQER